MWAYKGILPEIQDKRNEKLPVLLLQQIKDQMLLDSARFNQYSMTEMFASNHDGERFWEGKPYWEDRPA